MRTAAVVIPVCAIAAAAALTVFQLRPHHHEPPPAPTPASAVTIIKPPPTQAQPTQAPPKYAGPVGDQFLGEWSDLLLAKGDGPPMLFVLAAHDLNGRYGWRMPRVARLMAEELGSVLDDGCTTGCAPAAEAARTAVHAFVDDDFRADDAARTRAWDVDDAGIMTHMHRLAIRSHSGAVTLDVTCDCASWTVGMRMWNDTTACDATLREKGRVLATYQPRVRAMSDKESIEEPIDSYDQIVALPGGGMLVTETGWEYLGDNVSVPLTKTTVRTGPHWR